MKQALKVPIMAITQNAGKEGSVIVEYLLKQPGSGKLVH